MSRRYNLTFPPKTTDAIEAMTAFKELSVSIYLGQLARADHDAHLEQVGKAATAGMTPLRASKAKEEVERQARIAANNAWRESPRGRTYRWCEYYVGDSPPLGLATRDEKSPEFPAAREAFIDFILAYPGGKEAWLKQYKIDHPRIYINKAPFDAPPPPTFEGDPKPEFFSKGLREGAGVPRLAHEYWDMTAFDVATAAWFDRHPDA